MRRILVGVSLAVGLGVGFVAGMPSAQAARPTDGAASSCISLKCNEICWGRGYDYGNCTPSGCVCLNEA